MTTPMPVSINIVSKVITLIFDECNRFNDHETGGALIGFYGKNGNTLVITVAGAIGAGPNARRTATSFFKDGEYQEREFRRIEKSHPSVEHLGNWHTHHMNGYPTLSAGDCTTYHKHVNSPNHNTDFWYALLVTSKLDISRYAMKHFMLYRGNPGEYELESRCVQFIGGEVLS